MGQSFSYLLLYYSLSKEILYPFIDSCCNIFMNNIMKAISALVILALIVVIMANTLYTGTTPLGSCGGAPSVVFSEFKEENNSGIYTTEILEYEKTDCSNAWKNMYIYLIDAEGVAHGDKDLDNGSHGWFNGGKFIANYEGENPYNINITSNMANDTNGTKYPVRIINNMSEDPSLNESYNPNWREGGSYDYGLKLSIGDKIIVYGSGSEADGIAREGWSLRIKYQITGETLSEIKIA